MDLVKRIDNYEILKTLGKGSTCKVKLCRNVDTGTRVALKIYFESKGHLLSVESNALEKLRSHPNIIHLFDFVPQGKYFKPGHEGRTVSYLVLELCKNGEIFDFIMKLGAFPEDISRKLFIDLLNAIEALHESGQVHRDIKPENIFLSDNYDLKLSDFGFCAPCEGRDSSGYLHSFKGTRPYMAPEILERKAYNGQSTDLFSCGIILFIFVYGRPPFARADLANSHYVNIVNRNWERFWRFHSCGNVSKGSQGFKDLIQKMLAYDPSERLSMDEIRNHPWVLEEKASQERCKEFLAQMDLQEIQSDSSHENSNIEGYRGEFGSDLSLSLSRNESRNCPVGEIINYSICKAVCKADLDQIFKLALDFCKQNGEIKVKENDFEFKLLSTYEAIVEIYRAGESEVLEMRRLQGDRWEFYKAFESMIRYIKNNL